jgi:hypothetical protein
MEESELMVLIRPKFCVCFVLAEDENSVNNLIGTVDGRPECLRSSTDSRPSLKRLNNSNVLA